MGLTTPFFCVILLMLMTHGRFNKKCKSATFTMTEFYPIKSRFTPQVEWFTALEFPVFRTVRCIRLEIRDVDSIIYVNEKGQIVNLARETGTDNVNAAGIKSSLLSQGLCVTEVPPIILNDGRLIDGYTRQSVIVDLKQDKWIYLVVELNEGYTIEDAYDEVGLGANNHLTSKPATVKDFKKRLSAWINRQNSVPTLQDCINWFNNIPHSFDDKQVKKACEDVINKHLTSVSMESFNAKTAAALGAEILGVEGSKVLAINNSNTTYFERVVYDQLMHFDETGDVAPVVGFLDKVSAEDSELHRKNLRKKAAKVNRAFAKLIVKYQEDPEFMFFPFEGCVGQQVGVEDRNNLY
jgi:hypothetical protein